jgi:transposase, IS5 family
MNQLSFADAEYAGKRKKTRREVFLEEMEQVVPWKALLKVIEPFYPMAGRGRRPYPLEAMLRVHLMQNWFALSDPAMEEALYEMASLRNFAGLKLSEAIPDETTILNFRHLLEEYDLAEDILKQVNAHLTRKGLLLKKGSIVDATIIPAPSSTKNEEGERDPEMHQTKKGNQWYFGMKAHIGVDADSGLVHTVTTTAANEADVEQVADLLHGKERNVWADAGYRGAQTRVDRQGLKWHIAARPSDIAKMPDGRAKTRLQKQEHRKASVRAKVEHPFRVIKRQFGLVKVRFRGLQKNTAHLLTLFALSNLWMVRRSLMAMQGAVRPKGA